MWTYAAAQNLIFVSSDIFPDLELSESDPPYIAANIKRLFESKAEFNEFIRGSSLDGYLKVWLIVP